MMSRFSAWTIGLSIMSGAHLPICEKLMQRVREEGLEDRLVVVGGVIPKEDVPKLKTLGVKGVFPGGTPLQEIVDFILKNAPTREGV